MDRAEKTGLGIATAGHIALFAALSLGLAVSRMPPPAAQPIEVSFVKDVGVTSAAPQPSLAPPAESAAPEVGSPDEAAPAPPDPAPAPSQAMSAPPHPAPASPKAIKAEPRPSPKPAPAPEKPMARPAVAPPTARPAPAKPAPQRIASTAGTGKVTRGSRLSFDMLKGIGSDPSPAKAQQAQAAMTGAARASIAAAIVRQVKPCADRMVNPGPGADQIKVTIALKLNRDGSLRARPVIEDTTGVDEDNRRYVERVKDMAVATFVGCSPLHDLPADLYDVPGGWSDFALRYNLP